MLGTDALLVRSSQTPGRSQRELPFDLAEAIRSEERKEKTKAKPLPLTVSLMPPKPEILTFYKKDGSTTHPAVQAAQWSVARQDTPRATLRAAHTGASTCRGTGPATTPAGRAQTQGKHLPCTTKTKERLWAAPNEHKYFSLLFRFLCAFFFFFKLTKSRVEVKGLSENTLKIYLL